jgi:hypothetical protein
MFEISKKYRTKSSLNDSEVKIILHLLENELYEQTTDDLRPLEHIKKENYKFLDFGCHLGHLSIELALRYPIEIIAVDNFWGTDCDQLMLDEIKKATGGQENFHLQLLDNIEENRGQFKGKIFVIPSVNFWQMEPVKFNFAFIDADHRSSAEFPLIDTMIPSGGILGGHDNQHGNPDTIGVLKGIDMIKHNYNWIDSSPLFFMRKK